MRATRALIGAVAVLALAAGVVTVASPVPNPPAGLVVHEWGTFSSFSGSDGALLKFHPNNNDLPKFVYSTQRYTKGEMTANVSLETPVLYFYSDKPLTASVRAEFPNGYFTEWFPQAERATTAKTLTWAEVRVQPGQAATLPTAPGPSHYFAAREVDAAPVEVVKKNEHQDVHEHERFLFYRGAGDPKPPLSVVAVGGGSFALRDVGDGPIAAGMLLEVKDRQVRFKTLESVSARRAMTVELPPNWSDGEPARAALVTMLIRAGLFEKEARAMVKTWESTWFGDAGTRILYVLPNGWTDRTLPLRVTPAPDTLVRVMVGRHDVLTPEREREIDGLVQQLNGPDRKTAEAALLTLGRFEGPARAQAEHRHSGRR
jgi:hypothetical protein